MKFNIKGSLDLRDFTLAVALLAWMSLTKDVGGQGTRGNTSPDPVRIERTGVVMGTELRVVVDADGRDTALAAAEYVLREVKRFDQLFSTWDPTTPMSRLNEAPLGEAMRTDQELLGLLVEVESWARRTGRVFEPAVGALVDAWGLRSGGARPDPATLEAARAATGPAALDVSADKGTVTRLRPDAWIDTGGFGKGAALRSAGAVLSARGIPGALLDLGGQLLALGEDGSTGGPWRVGVAHPRRRHEPVAHLRLEDVSVATSGNQERAGTAGGEPVGHLLDPRTGRPAPIWGSVTVVAADPLVADVLSTALYVMGPRAGLTWSAQLEDVGALFLEERDGVLVPCWNAAMLRWLVSIDGVPLAAGDDRAPGDRRGQSCTETTTDHR